jgi:hypothetical protein
MRAIAISDNTFDVGLWYVDVSRELKVCCNLNNNSGECFATNNKPIERRGTEVMVKGDLSESITLHLGMLCSAFGEARSREVYNAINCEHFIIIIALELVKSGSKVVHIMRMA